MSERFPWFRKGPQQALVTSVVVLLLILQNPLTNAQAQGAKAPLTNQDVIKMVQAHLGTEVITAQIRSNPGNYSLSTDSLIALKKLGVPDKVITAMQAKGSGAASESKLSPGSPDSAGRWRVINQEDPLTHVKNVEAILSVPADYGGRHGEAQITTSCDNFSSGPNPGAHNLYFEIVYTSQSDKELGFAHVPPDSIYDSRTPGANARWQGPYVRFRVGIDGRVVTMKSSDDHPNVLGFAFDKDVAGSPGDVAMAYGAKLISVVLPLANGDTPVVEIKPQDPSFRDFAATCPGSGVVHAGPPPTVVTVEQFEAMLPTALRKAAVARGADPHTYDKELEFIKKTLDSCLLNPPQTASGPANGPVDSDSPVCAWNAYHLHMVDGFVNYTTLAANPRGEPGPQGAGDLFLTNTGGKVLSWNGRGGQLWAPGETYNISLKIFSSRTGGYLNFDDVLVGVQMIAAPIPPKPDGH